MRKLLREIIKIFLIINGYPSYAAMEISSDISIDLFDNKNTTLKEKIWSYRKGFLSDKIFNYKLNNLNIKNYLSDFDYYKLYPLNGYYRKWIDDKITLRYILSNYNKYLPKYYYHLINKNKIIPLIDCEKKNCASYKDIFDKLKKEKCLALKPIGGTKGQGFYKLSYFKGIYYINNNKMKRKKIIVFFNKLNDYVITEYCFSHSDINRIYAKSANTLRLMVIKDPNKGAIITNAMMRFGSDKTQYVDNISAGGLFCRVDIDTGYFDMAKTYNNFKIIEQKIHPNTKEKIEGYIPHWNIITKTIESIGNYLIELDIMGFDIIITQNSFKIIEINSHQGIFNLQHYYPFLLNERTKHFFNSKKKKNL